MLSTQEIEKKRKELQPYHDLVKKKLAQEQELITLGCKTKYFQQFARFREN